MFESAEEIHRPHGAEGRADPTRRLYSMRSHTEVFVGLQYLGINQAKMNPIALSDELVSILVAGFYRCMRNHTYLQREAAGFHPSSLSRLEAGLQVHTSRPDNVSLLLPNLNERFEKAVSNVANLATTMSRRHGRSSRPARPRDLAPPKFRWRERFL